MTIRRKGGVTVYSKEKGITSPPAEVYARRPGRTPRVSVPPNYRGHAIVDGEEQPLGLWENTNPHPAADVPVPRFDDLPRVSSLGDGHRHPPPAYPILYGDNSDHGEVDRPRGDDVREEAYVAETGSFHSPPQDRSPAAPPRRFGGTLSLGLEELLLMGLILFLLREGEECPDRGDLDETVILLGLLLLLG